MEENIKVRWLVDNEQTKIAPKTLSTQILNEDGTHFKDTVENAIADVETEVAAHASNSEIHVTAAEKEAWNNIEVPSLEGYATEAYVENLYTKLNSNTVLGFYCIEDVTIVTNGISKVYPANSNVEVSFIEGDTFEIIPTSDKSILALTAFPGALGTFYPWLEGVRQFSNILFDMNNVDFYSKWSQGNQGLYQVQFAQYSNCIFWSDNAYVSDLTKRTNYTLYYTAQLPLCYSTIPDNTFKTFFLALGVNSDPNWGNPLYRESFAKANWATQAFSYYGARTVGLPSLDADEFNIVLPKDCRGLMFDARYIENAGVFDATNTTNFGAKSGSWRDAFGYCISLKSLQIKNLKVNLNISWSPIDYISIKYIIDNAANTNAITIYVSPYTYNLLSQADFDLATSKNITIALLSTNYVEDKRLGEIANKADKTYVDNQIAGLINSAPETLDTLGELATAFSENVEVVNALNDSIVNKQNKNVIIYKDSETEKASMTAPEIMEKVRAGENVYYTTNLSGGTLHPYLEGADTGVFFYSNYINNDRAVGTGILISADGTITSEAYELEHLTDTTIHITAAEREKWNNTYSKTETDGLLEAKANVENPVFSGTLGLNHTGTLGFASASLGFANEASGMYCFSEGMGNKATGDSSHAEGTGTTASKDAAHAEGYGTVASNVGSHAEGASTVASGYGSHAEGSNTIASIEGQHVEGKYNIDDTSAIHIVGNGTSSSARSNAHTLGLNGEAWFSGDVYTGSISGTNKDEGSKKLATEEYVNNNSFSGDYEDLTNKPFYSEEAWTFISDTFSDNILTVTINEDQYSNCFSELGRYRFTINGTDIYEYEKTSSSGQYIIGDASMQTIPFALMPVHQDSTTKKRFRIIGSITITSCKAEYYTSSTKHLDDIFLSSNIARTEDLVGVKTTQGGEIFNDIANNKAQATYAHAEGEGTDASGQASHAEGRSTIANGTGAHAEGLGTFAFGHGSHTEGTGTQGNGYNTHAEGEHTIASGDAQHVEGKSNIESVDFIHIAGNGTSPNTRSNAHTLDWDGNAWYAGDVYVGSTSGKNKDEGSKKLATEEYVDNKEYDFFILKSSTPGSSKKFKITITDDGILSSEEVVE